MDRPKKNVSPTSTTAAVRRGNYVADGQCSDGKSDRESIGDEHDVLSSPASTRTRAGRSRRGSGTASPPRKKFRASSSTPAGYGGSMPCRRNAIAEAASRASENTSHRKEANSENIMAVGAEASSTPSASGMRPSEILLQRIGQPLPKDCREELLKPFDYDWRRLLVKRNQRSMDCASKSSKTVADAYYYAPCGKKLRSTVEVQAYLSEHKNPDLSVDCFTYLRRPIACGIEPYEVICQAGETPRYQSLVTKNESGVAEVEMRRSSSGGGRSVKRKRSRVVDHSAITSDCVVAASCQVSSRKLDDASADYQSLKDGNVENQTDHRCTDSQASYHRCTDSQASDHRCTDSQASDHLCTDSQASDDDEIDVQARDHSSMDGRMREDDDGQAFDDICDIDDYQRACGGISGIREKDCDGSGDIDSEEPRHGCRIDGEELSEYYGMESQGPGPSCYSMLDESLEAKDEWPLTDYATGAPTIGSRAANLQTPEKIYRRVSPARRPSYASAMPVLQPRLPCLPRRTYACSMPVLQPCTPTAHRQRIGDSARNVTVHETSLDEVSGSASDAPSISDDASDNFDDQPAVESTEEQYQLFKPEDGMPIGAAYLKCASCRVYLKPCSAREESTPEAATPLVYCEVCFRLCNDIVKEPVFLDEERLTAAVKKAAAEGRCFDAARLPYCPSSTAGSFGDRTKRLLAAVNGPAKSFGRMITTEYAVPVPFVRPKHPIQIVIDDELLTIQPEHVFVRDGRLTVFSPFTCSP